MVREAELTGVVKPETDDRALERTASKMEGALDEATQLAPKIDTSSIRRKFESAIPGGGLLGGALDKLTGRGGGGGGLGAGGPGALGDQTLQLQTAQLSKLDEIQETVEKGAVSGGGGLGPGGGGFLGGLIGGGKGSSLSSLVGGVSFGALVSKVSLSSLLKKIPAFATLVTAASLSDELVEGTLGPDDLVESSIKLGEIMTFGLSPNDLVSGTIGAATLIGGTVQIASFISGKLSGTALAGYLGNVGMGTLVNPLSGSLVALLGGSIALHDLVDGEISKWNLPAKFGKALGEGFAKAWPDMADKIHNAFTDNPIYDFGQDVGESWDRMGENREFSTDLETGLFDVRELPVLSDAYNTGKDVGNWWQNNAPSWAGGSSASLARGAGVNAGPAGVAQPAEDSQNRAKNRRQSTQVDANVTNEVRITDERQNVREQLRQENMDPDIIEEIVRQWDQVKRQLGGR